MESLIAIILYCLVTVLLVYYEKRKFGTIFNMIFFLAAPFAIMLILSYIFIETFGFYALNAKIVYVWLFAIIVFFCVGNFVTFGYRYKQKATNSGASNSTKRKNNTLLTKNFKLVTSLIIALVLIKIMSEFISEGFSLSVSEALFSGGLWGHLLVALCAIGIIYFGQLKISDLWSDLNLIGVFMLLFLANVKTDIILVLAGGLICRVLMGKLKLRLKVVIFAAIGACVVFFAIYVLDFCLQRGRFALDKNTLKFIFNHLFYYLFSGIGGFGTYIKGSYSLDMSLLFAPVDNILKFLGLINGGYINIINESVQVGPNLDTNVATLMGEVYMAGELIAVFIFSSCIAIVSYLLYKRARRGHVFSMIAVSYISAMLIIGIFGNPFWRLSVIEVPFYVFIIYFCKRFFSKKRKGASQMVLNRG